MFRRFLFVLPFVFSIAASLPAQQATPPANAEAGTGAEASAPAAPVRAQDRPEDWTNVKVDREKVKPILPGLSMGIEEKPAYTRELIRMEWRHGDFIDMYLVKPHGVKKPRVILYLYSFPSNSDRFMNDGWCTRVTQDGMAAAGFVSALTGERFRNRPMKEWFVSELQESLGSSAHDVQLILDYLSTRADVSVDRVGMWGQGSGASIAILAAVADSRIAALDLLNPWGDWADWLKTSPVVPDSERPRYVTADFLQKVSMLDPVDYLPTLRDRALRVQQVNEDADTPLAAREKIAAAVPPGHVVVYKDFAEHKEAWKKAGVSSWIAAQLGAQAPSAESAAASQTK